MCPEDNVVETVVTPAPETAPESVVEPAAPETPKEPPVSKGKDKEAPAAAAAPVEPPYTPNFKVKVMDQEKEIPEAFRALMKDAKTEKEVKEIFEKAYGLDFAKPKHEATTATLTKIQSEHNFLLGSVQELRDTYQRGDLDGFFQKLSIPPERVLQWAVDKVKYQELPQDQKALIDAQQQTARQNAEYQRQNATLQQQMQEQVVQARQSVLNSELARPEIKSMMDSFDQRAGAPGAFVREVINRGQLAWFQSQGKVDLTPGQAIEQVVSLYGLKQQAQASVHTQPTNQGNGSGGQKTNTIPNVGSGRSVAPLKQKPRSIEDLKKLRDAME